MRLKPATLLACTAAGRGRYYRFLGYAARRYDTVAVVTSTDARWVRVLCPEWHPGLEITVAASSVPASEREPGRWLGCAANLGATSPAQVEPHSFKPLPASRDLASYPEPRIAQSPTAPAPAELPTVGPGCGDIVLHVSETSLADAGAGAVYLTGHVPPIAEGGRIYLAVGSRMHGWREAAGVSLLPNGYRIRMRGPMHPADGSDPPALPPDAVDGGSFGQQAWSWRTWPI